MNNNYENFKKASDQLQNGLIQAAQAIITRKEVFEEEWEKAKKNARRGTRKTKGLI